MRVGGRVMSPQPQIMNLTSFIKHLGVGELHELMLV